MVTRVILVDDLDGSTEHVTSHRIELDGAAYDIDLAPHHVERLHADLSPFVSAARRIAPHRADATPSPRTAGLPTAAEIRTWWARQPAGSALPRHQSLGPIPRSVRQAYDAYRAAPSPPPPTRRAR